MLLMMLVGDGWFEMVVLCGFGMLYCYLFDDVFVVFDFVLCF